MNIDFIDSFDHLSLCSQCIHTVYWQKFMPLSSTKRYLYHLRDTFLFLRSVHDNVWHHLFHSLDHHDHLFHSLDHHDNVWHHLFHSLNHHNNLLHYLFHSIDHHDLEVEFHIEGHTFVKRSVPVFDCTVHKT